MKILAIYDKPSFVDRYSVYFDVVEKVQEDDAGKCHTLYMVLGMSVDPFSPNTGVCQHSCGQLGAHNGKKIRLRDLPVDCLVALVQELQDFD